jgi:hypothetical protein
MLKEKVVISLAILAILCWGIVSIIRLDKEFNSIINNINVVEFPIHNGKVIIGNKAIEEQSFRKLVDITISTITSSASIQTKTEKLIGCEITDITLGEPDCIEKSTTIIEKEKTPFDNNWTKNMIYSIYSDNKPLIHDMIDIYKRKWYDPEFKIKVKNFVNENK